MSFDKTQLIDAERLVQSLDKIEAAEVKAAFLRLLIGAERAGFTAVANSGVVYAVHLYTADDVYAFSYIANKQHLLFYLRHPAFKAYPKIQAEAERSEFAFTQNPHGELNVRVETVAEADSLFAWIVKQTT